MRCIVWARRARVAVAVGACVSCVPLAACREPGDQRTDTLDPSEARARRAQLSESVVAQLDSGSAAFSSRDYAGALRHYQAAVAGDSTVAAAWFGVYMAQTALGDQRAAEDAFARARSLEPAASLLHPSEGGSP